ncbi:MAG: metal ABC transporter permease [Geminicoccaceae bacterium]
MLDGFVLRALLAGLGVALAAGPLGCFVVWRRMALFGEALANASLLGIVLALLLGLNLALGVIVFCLLLAFALTRLERQQILPLDTLLSILAHGALAAGLLVLSFMDRVRVDLMSLLLGDVLAVDRVDLLLVGATAALVLGTVTFLWRPLLSATVDPDLARVEGLPVDRLRLIVVLLVAALIAVGMKVVGILLVVSLLVIPAAAARGLVASPEAMSRLASCLGALAVIAGIMLSLQADVPTGPAIVASAVAIFALATAARGLKLATSARST